MSKYSILTNVESASGWQEWEVEADSPEEALRKFKEKGGTFVTEEVLVDSLGEPEIVAVDGVKYEDKSE